MKKSLVRNIFTFALVIVLACVSSQSVFAKPISAETSNVNSGIGIAAISWVDNYRFTESMTISNMTGNFGGAFAVPSGYKRLTVSALANNIEGATTVTITLQKKNIIGIWSNVSSATISTSGQQSIIFTGVSVSGTLRFIYNTNGMAANAMIAGVFGQ